jgi:hypothetical protein
MTDAIYGHAPLLLAVLVGGWGWWASERAMKRGGDGDE